MREMREADDGSQGDDAYAGLSPRARRKRKNRDQMRAARQREKDTMERLRVMVERLESQYQTLQQQQEGKEAGPSTLAAAVSAREGATPPAAATATATATTLAAEYADVISLKAHFQEENFHLKQTLYEKNKLKETLERHVGDFVEPTPEELVILKQELSTDTVRGDGRATPPPPVSPPQSCGGDGGFVPLSENAVWTIIGDVHRRMTAIQHEFLARSRCTTTGPSHSTITVLPPSSGSSSSSSPSPSASQAANESVATPPGASDDEYLSHSLSPPSPPPTHEPLPAFCGWDVSHYCELNHIRFSFAKAFPHIAAFEAMTRMWENELAMTSYRDARAAQHQTMRVVQQLNSDTYIFQRRLADATTNNREVVSTYLRYRVRTTRGFLIGAVAIDDAADERNAAAASDGDGEHVWASKLCIWTEFTPIVSNAGCSVRITGSTNLDSPLNAQRNVASVIIGLLRWENLNIGPMFALTER